jgi:hypothetical protein
MADEAAQSTADSSISHDRIDAMLATTAQNEVRALSDDVLRRHALLGPLFPDETVEVV